MLMKLNLQRFVSDPLAPMPIYVNGNLTSLTISYFSDFENNSSNNSTMYTISNGKVVWKDGTILQYNGVDVLPSDGIVENRQYTTRANGSSTTKLIKIKFKDTLTFTSDQIFDITFKSNNQNFTQFLGQYGKGFTLSYNSTSVYDFINGWTTPYNIIEIDPTQASFNAFIAAMKDNIESVELEAGTYKWVDNPNPLQTSAVFNFISNNISMISISCGADIFYSDINSEDYRVWRGATGNWSNENYKTIVTSSNQYINYEFYNYAILGNQLVKQQPTPTSYSITYNLINCTSDSSNPTTIENTASVIITVNRGYKLPSTITVTNATYTYEQSTGMIDLSNPTGDVTITVVATQDDIIVYENQLVSIANAIRQVNSSSAKIKLDDMPNLIGTFAKPTGTKTITDTNLTDVRNYANAQVSDANLTSANIVTGKTILGIAGSFSSDGTLDASKMLKGVIGYSKGNKIIGIIETYNGEIIEE